MIVDDGNDLNLRRSLAHERLGTCNRDKNLD